MKKSRQYLYCNHFTLATDHQALKYLMTTSDLTGKLARWTLRLQEYDFEIKYRPGSANANADGLRLTSPGQAIKFKFLKFKSEDVDPGNLKIHLGNLGMMQKNLEEAEVMSDMDAAKPSGSSSFSALGSDSKDHEVAHPAMTIVTPYGGTVVDIGQQAELIMPCNASFAE